MKAKGLALLLAAALLFTGCTTRPLSFTLNKAGCYTGFSDIEETYSREAAARYGYLVRRNFEVEDNGELWEDFLNRAAQGKRASIRIASFYEGGVSFADLFYRDGKYRVFFSDSQDLLDQPYSCLLILYGPRF